jgi:hypothetical protein
MLAAFKSQDTRTYAASAVFVVLVLMLMLFLTFVPIPSGNKDLIVSIISMMVGGLGVAIGKLFGESNTEVDKLRTEVRELRAEVGDCDTRHQVTKEAYDRIVEMLVNRVELGVKP